MTNIKKHKVAFLSCELWEEKYIKKYLKNAEVRFFKKIETKSDYKKLQKFDILSGFIYSNFTEEILSLLPNLKYISTRSTGFNHIDIKIAKKMGIKVSNVPLYGANTVAEHTFALLLALSRKIYDSLQRTKKSNFDLTGLRGFDLQGKTIGIVGTGSIGSHAVRIAYGFEMNILMFDPYKNKSLEKKFNAKYVSLNKLLKESDIISLHLPYNKKTHHILNKKSIAMMKKGSYIINTSRGGLVDTKVLIKALVSGRLAGAGLDVLEEEGLIKEEIQLLDRQASRKALSTVLESHILLKMDNVVITPHNAFNSVEALHRILDTTIENINSYIKRRPQNLVN